MRARSCLVRACATCSTSASTPSPDSWGSTTGRPGEQEQEGQHGSSDLRSLPDRPVGVGRGQAVSVEGQLLEDLRLPGAPVAPDPGGGRRRGRGRDLEGAARRDGDVLAVDDDVDERLARRDPDVVPARADRATDPRDDLGGRKVRPVACARVDDVVESAGVPHCAEEGRSEAHLLEREVGGDVADGPAVAQRGAGPILRCQLLEHVGRPQPLCVDRGPEPVVVHARSPSR